MTVEDQILKEVKEIKKDGKATHLAVQNSALAIARIEGDVKLHTSQIERNTSDIAKNELKIGKTSEPAPGPGQPITFKWLAQNALLPIVMLIAGLMIAQIIAGGG